MSSFFHPRSLSVLLLGMLLALSCMLSPHAAQAAVPNDDAARAYAEEQTILQTERETPEPGWDSAASGRRHFDRHFIIPPGADSVSEQDLILQRGGNTWRNWRNGPFAMVSGIVLLVVPLIIFLFYQAVGPARLEHPETGRQIQRFSSWDRTIHWATAISFLVLAFSGLIILFGKTLLLPWMGHTAFSWAALLSKYLHNFFGPLFILCSLLMFFTFARKNIFKRWDWQWIKRGGGLASHQHVPAGYFNAGEKAWFWGGVTLLGLLMSATGLLLDFVNFGQTRYILQMANYLHIAGATLYIAASMGHIYIGTLGTPGAYQAMRHGMVDEEWARTHHELWYNEVMHNPPALDAPPYETVPGAPSPHPHT